MPKAKRKPSHVRHKTSSSVKFVYKPSIVPKSEDEVMLNVMEIIRQAGIAYIALKESKKRGAEAGNTSAGSENQASDSQE